MVLISFLCGKTPVIRCQGVECKVTRECDNGSNFTGYLEMLFVASLVQSLRAKHNFMYDDVEGNLIGV
jgi:hypothetical protein